MAAKLKAKGARGQSLERSVLGTDIACSQFEVVVKI